VNVSHTFAPLCITGVDTSGGVRVPAGFCGVLGFRPSHGAVSHGGIIPVSTSLDTVGMIDSFIYSDLKYGLLCLSGYLIYLFILNDYYICMV